MRLARSVGAGWVMGDAVAGQVERHWPASHPGRRLGLTVRGLSASTRILLAAGLLITLIAFVDSRINLSFGLFYLFPIILVGTVLPR